MGREIKRVALDFSWPTSMVWKGYISPYRSQECTVCDSSGFNPETKEIADAWYDFRHTGKRWVNQLTQDECDELTRQGRLSELLPYRCHFDKDLEKWMGWVNGERIEVEAPLMPSADVVNRWSRNGLGHDAINRWICVEVRARRLGVYGKCTVCGGAGEIWFNETIEKLASNWYKDERYDPPTGEGWQLWEDTTEGSPVSPVFSTSDGLIQYLVDAGYSESAAKSFVLDQQWVPSGLMVDGKIYEDIESLSVK